MLRLPGLLLASCAALFLLVGTTGAQCPTPDRLDGGPCCAATNANLPVFPEFRQDALGICWRGCAVDATAGYRARFRDLPAGGAPLPCGEKRVLLRLTGAAGLAWSGPLRLQYSRTWVETDAAGNQVQVWRWLANGDLTPAAGLGMPCPVPPCVPATGNRARFTGYVDYAETCGAPALVYEHAWMLTHACDLIDHAPGFPRAGVFHPDRSYTFVGPAAGFVPAAVLPTEAGAGALEAVRRRMLPVAGALPTCEFEEQIVHTLATIADVCLCGPAAAPTQHHIASLNLNGACGTAITTPGGPFLPGFVSMGIGVWTDPLVYPGVEQLRWNCGGYDYTDPCTGVTDQEVFFGVTTINGYPANQLLSVGVGAPLPPFFVDQSNSRRDGGAFATLMNLPFVSNHILNLNY